MRGLLEKDGRMLIKKKIYMLMVIVLAVVLSFQMTSSFTVSYLTMVGMILSLSISTLDEENNGLPFLMTLPFTRRTYVAEKYLFSVGVIALFWGMGMVLQFLMNLIRRTGMDAGEGLLDSLLSLVLFTIILAILLPIDLYFGAQKSRIAMVLVFGVCFFGISMGIKMAETLSLDVEALLQRIQSLSKLGLIGGGIVLMVLILGISLRVSTSLMERKEF